MPGKCIFVAAPIGKYPSTYHFLPLSQELARRGHRVVLLVAHRRTVFVLDGQKRFVVGAVSADLFLIYARTGAPDADPHRAISAFLVERGMGVVVEHVPEQEARFGRVGRLRGRQARCREEQPPAAVDARFVDQLADTAQ